MSVASITHGGEPVAFYWLNEQSPFEKDHIDAAVDALIAAADGDDRRLSSNPYHIASAKSAFRSRLMRLTRGVLEPIEEVKSLSKPRAPLFEVRWQHISVRQRTDTGFGSATIQIRLIYAEPPELGDAALGLHAHEKESEGLSHLEIKQAQDEHIDYAAALYERGEPDRWGVTLR